MPLYSWEYLERCNMKWLQTMRDKKFNDNDLVYLKEKVGEVLPGLYIFSAVKKCAGINWPQLTWIPAEEQLEDTILNLITAIPEELTYMYMYNSNKGHAGSIMKGKLLYETVDAHVHETSRLIVKLQCLQDALQLKEEYEKKRAPETKESGKRQEEESSTQPGSESGNGKASTDDIPGGKN